MLKRVVELLTMHLAPKQILINAHVKMRQGLLTDEVERTVEEVEDRIKQAEPKVEMIFLEAARDQLPESRTASPKRNIEQGVFARAWRN
jgi:hypothetical protein